METLGINLSDKAFYDISDHDLLDVWESDMASSVSDPFRSGSINVISNDMDPFWTSGLINPEHNSSNNNSNSFRDSNCQVVRNDRLLTDSVYDRLSSQHLSANSFQSTAAGNCNNQLLQQQQFATTGPVKAEHSYSLGLLHGAVGSDGDSLPDSPLSIAEDIDSDGYPYLSLRASVSTCGTLSLNDQDMLQSSSSSSSSSTCGSTSADSCLSSDEGCSLVKEEPQSRPTSPLPSVTTLLPSPLQHMYHQQTIGYLIKDDCTNEKKFSVSPIRPVATSGAIFLSPHSKKPRICSTDTKMINIKLESDQGPSSGDNDLRQQKNSNNSPGSITLFRTTGLTKSSTTSPTNVVQSRNIATTKVIFGQSSLSGTTRHPIQTSLISYQPKGATGDLSLTEEEKRTLISEGYPIPQRLPLTKSEEKSLKKIRRKIKNKISAQESRRKKKEYMDTLEKRMDGLSNEVDTYRQRCSYLEQQNSALQQQLQKLQAQLSNNNKSNSSLSPSKTSVINQRSKN